jgi:hypothetical protein
MSSEDPRAFADSFRDTADYLAVRGSNLYAALLRGVAGDEAMLALARAAPDNHLPPHLLMGVVHFMVLREPDDPLARFYGSITETPEPPDQAFGAFRRYCLDHADEIRSMLATRILQSNSPRRAGFVLPAMMRVAEQTGGAPISLIEVGCSAGLLTQFDQYRYDYGHGAVIGSGPGPVLDGFRFRDRQPDLAGTMPVIAARAGVDLAPINVADADERLWIEALIPPEDGAERALVRQALDLRLTAPFPLRRGDAMVELPALLKAMPDPVCVFHSTCLYQWPASARLAFADMLRRESAGRVIHRLSLEGIGIEIDPADTTTHLSADEAPEPGITCNITHLVYRDGEVSSTLLGRYDGWGREGIWLG